VSDFNAISWQALAVAAVVAVLTAIAGGVMTVTGDWYQALRMPAWKPPDWAFGPVWTTIFVLAVLAAAIGWGKAQGDAARMVLVGLFALNVALNVLWNVLFFALRRPDWALIETGALWLSIAALMLALWPISATASLLLAPYLVWVSIAWALNGAIVRLNAPFARTA
jgi:tryptophan-rich sensory protein